jgi:hypothetical protein
MGTASVVVRDILLEHGTQVTFVDDQNATVTSLLTVPMNLSA